MNRADRLRRLFASPIAHRGLHDPSAGRVENTIAAGQAAVMGGFGVECDVQLSADGEAMVFHDFELDRLTACCGPICALPARRLSEIGLVGSQERIPSLPGFLAALGDGCAIVCEIKSRFDGDMRLADRAARIAASWRGAIAIESFDPDIIAYLRSETDSLGLADVPLGLVAMARYEGGEWASVDREGRRRLAALAHWPTTRPDFLSFFVDDLPHAAPSLCRAALGVPVSAWTVRTPRQSALAKAWADQIVFERMAIGQSSR